MMTVNSPLSQLLNPIEHTSSSLHELAPALPTMIRDGLRNVTKTLFEIGCYWLVIIGGVICGLYTAIVGEKRYTPRPVSTVGRRRLSASFKPGALGLIDQSKFSYLFSKLSPELRLMIYREVLGDHLIHIGLCPGKNRRDNARMAHVRCPFVKNYSCDQWKYRGCNLRRIPKYSDNNRVIDLSYRPSASHYGTTKGLLSLLKTCRQMYVRLLYIIIHTIHSHHPPTSLLTPTPSVVFSM